MQADYFRYKPTNTLQYSGKGIRWFKWKVALKHLKGEFIFSKYLSGRSQRIAKQALGRTAACNGPRRKIKPGNLGRVLTSPHLLQKARDLVERLPGLRQDAPEQMPPMH